MLLHEIVEFAARRAPTAPALVFGDRTATFAHLRAGVERMAGVAAGWGRPGDRVAIVADNSPAYVEAYYGVPAAGRILVPLNQRLHPEEWAAQLAAAAPVALLGTAEHLERLLPLGDRFPSVAHVGEVVDGGWALVGAEPPGAGQPPGVLDERQTAWVIFTSGTTGRAKGVRLTHRSLLAAVTATAIARPVAGDDVYLFPFPLCHVAGYNVPLFHLHGRAVVLLPRFSAPDVLAAVARHRVTAMSLAPTMISMVLESPELDEADLSSLRAIGYGASGIPAGVLRRGIDRLGCDFAQGYGMTELSGNAAFLSGADHRRGVAGDEALLRSAGRPGPLVSLRIVDPEAADGGRVAERPAGEVGEIVVRGDQVTPGYWEDPAADAAAFVEGWFRTGDLGVLDERGYLTVVDRRKDVIVTGGENVASREVEEVLHRQPGVLEAAVVGVPDDVWGEAVCAVVVRRGDEAGAALDPAAVVEHCRAHLAGFKRPRHVVFLDDLPKNAAGKIQKVEVRELAARELTRSRGGGGAGAPVAPR